MFQRFTRDARAVVVAAQREADRLGAAAIGPEHLLLGVVDGRPDDPAARVLADAGLDAPGVHAALARELADALAPLGIPAEAVDAIGPVTPTGRSLRFSPTAKAAMQQALRSAVERGDRRIGARHMALGALRVPSTTVQRLLDDAGTDRAQLSRALAAVS